MNDDSSHVDRLAKRAKELDDMIAKATQTQKRIMEEIQRIGLRDRLAEQRASAAQKARRSKKRRS